MKIDYKKEYELLTAEFEQYKKESVKWGIEDFMQTEHSYCGKKYTITKEQAQDALERMIYKHDANEGIHWETIKYYIECYGTLES